MKDTVDNSKDHPPSPDQIGSHDSLDYENDEIDNENDEIDEDGSIEENSEVLHGEDNNDEIYEEEIVAEEQGVDGDVPDDEKNADEENDGEGNEESMDDASDGERDQDGGETSSAEGDEDSSPNDSSMDDRSYSSTDEDCGEPMTDESEDENDEETCEEEEEEEEEAEEEEEEEGEEEEEEEEEAEEEEEEEEEMEEEESADELESRQKREDITGGSVQNEKQCKSPMNDENQPSSSKDFQANEARKDKKKKKKEKSKPGPQHVSAMPRWNHNNIFDWPDEVQEEFLDISGMSSAERKVFYEMKLKMKKVRRELKKVRKIHKLKRRLKWLKKQEKKLRKERMKRILLEVYQPSREPNRQGMPFQDGADSSGETQRKKRKSEHDDGMRNMSTNEAQPSPPNAASGVLEGLAQIYRGSFPDENSELQEHIVIPTGDASTHVITMGARVSYASTPNDRITRMHQHVLYNPGNFEEDYIGPIINNPYSP